MNPFASCRLSLLCLTLILTGTPLLQGAVATLTPTADTGIFEDFPNNNLGAATTVPSGRLAGNMGADGTSRMLMRFDLTGQVPVGSVVNSVSLRLRVTKTPSFTDVDSNFGLHRLFRTWGEGTKVPGASTGTGALATTGEATWNSRFHNQTAWSTPGGASGTDYAPTASSSTFVSGVATYTLNSTAALVSDVQAWVNDPSTNHGWMLISDNEATLRTARRFATREHATSTFRPTLTIDFVNAPPTIDRVVLVNGQIRMTFRAQQGSRYEVQQRADAGTGDWVTYTNIGPVNFTGNLTVGAPANQPALFYQLVEFAP